MHVHVHMYICVNYDIVGKKGTEIRLIDSHTLFKFMGDVNEVFVAGISVNP